MRDTIVFDLDGTIADTAGDLIDAANAAMAALGHDAVLRHGADDATAFRGGRAMLDLAVKRLGLADGDGVVEAGYPILLEAYGRSINVHTRLYPGVVEAIDRLRDRGAATAICTNKPEKLAIDLIDRLGLSPLFDALVGADTLSVRKPDPAPYVAAVERSGGTLKRSLLVGDTLTDRQTATAAGVPCILVTFGPAGRAVADLRPDAMLDHFDELDQVIAKVLRVDATCS